MLYGICLFNDRPHEPQNYTGGLPFRMTESELTQFFQFDKEGNMYVFAPGPGCTGPMRLVRPGDELIFNSSYHAREWATDSSVKTEYDDTALASSCLARINASTACIFCEPLPKQDLVELSHKSFSAETLKQIRWVRKMYHDWREYRHAHGLAFIACDLEDSATITAESLKFALCRFTTEVKKIDSQDFPGKTLYHIVVCVQFHLECMAFASKLINDPAFKDLRFTLDNTIKARVSQGIGISVKKAQVIMAMDEDLLWSLGYLGTSYPEQLLNTVIFCIGKGFALQAGQEHWVLCGLPFESQFKFMKDVDGEVFLQYREDIGLKTNKGGLKHQKTEAKTMDLYAAANADRCPSCAIIKYLSVLPKTRMCSAFYLQPWKKFFGKAWYMNRPCDINHLRSAVSECQSAGLPFIHWGSQWPQSCIRTMLMSRSSWKLLATTWWP